ncbi:MAG: methyltransferase domain-containing protein [Hyphomicrobiales bacterium]
MSDFTAFGDMERNGWSETETASAYANGFASATAMCVPAMVAAVSAGTGYKALDLCCGHGIVAKGLHDAGAQVTGLDFSPAMLDLARTSYPEIEFIAGDATDTSYDDNSFDAVTMGFGILHIPDAAKALKEVKRILKPGGKFAYSVWHGPEQSAAFRIVFSAIGAHGDTSIALPPGPAIHDFADKEFATAALSEAGFTSPYFDTVNSHWMVEDAGTPVDFFMEGTVRGAALLRAQPKEKRAAIRNAVTAQVEDELGPTGPWKVGIPAAIVSAVA